MAPKVQVPADFGKHHIGKPSHGNLIFKLQDGEEIRGNSMILSLNSPVIDHLTTNLDQQTLDVDDFHKEAVDCFIEAAYTGELENINKSNFRDVNKMSHVFDVMWLRNKCAEYFKLLVTDLHDKEYEDILFVVEEARFTSTALKDRDFLNLVLEKLGGMVTQRDAFVEKYMVDFNTFPKKQLDVAIDLVGVDVHVLVSVLTAHIEIHNENLKDNTRYLLENINLSLCVTGCPYQFRRKCDALFTALENVKNVTKEDYTLMLKLTKQYAIGKPSTDRLMKIKKISNIFSSLTPFTQFKDIHLYDIIEELAASEYVLNLYMFFDAVWMWFFQYEDNDITCDQQLLDKIINVKKNREWHSISFMYVDQFIEDDDTKKFTELIKGCVQLVSHDNDGHYAISMQQYTRDEFVEAIFMGNTKLNFPIDSTECTEKGSLELTLLTTPASIEGDQNQFNIEICTGSNNQYKHYSCNSKIHSDFMISTQLHIAVNVKFETMDEWVYIPLSWCHKPYRDKTGKHRRWGLIQFTTTGETIEWPENEIDNYIKSHWDLETTDIDARLRFVVYF